MQTNDHPQDSIPAFVLGTLDIDEALLVHAHIHVCAGCRAEAEAFQAVLSTLPYAAAPRHPPKHIKHQLLARIAVAASAERAPTPNRAPTPATPRWMQAATGGALVLSLAFGMMFYNTSSRVTLMDNELAQNRQSISAMNQQHADDQTAIAQVNEQHTQDVQAIKQMETQIARDQQMAVFIAAPQTQARGLEGTDQRAHATMYMQPDSSQAVLVVAGLPRPAPGMTYQFWLAKPGIQIPSKTFDVTDDGLAMLEINAPAAINQFDQVMVTIEQAGGATQPSNKIVLSGSLTAANRLFDLGSSNDKRWTMDDSIIVRHPSSIVG